MSKKFDAFGDEIVTKDAASFEELFEQSMTVGKKLRVGDNFKGEILSIGKEETFVSTGTPVDAMILNKDIQDQNKEFKHKVGDVVEFTVIAIKNGEIRAGVRGAMGSATDSLIDAFEMELPIEGKVTEVVNGGFRVALGGAVGFCPISQMDTKRIEASNSAEYVGKKFEFIITQFEPKKRNIVISRRKLLDLQKAEFEGTFLQSHKIGDLLPGTVTRLETFGAFVELEHGIEGLVHISELSWQRLHNPADAVTRGQQITVKLLKVEDIDGRLKISLSLKQADGAGNPWFTVPEKFPVGSIHTGTIEKKETYGMFVNLAPGITGLFPKAKWRDSDDAATYENKKRGDTVSVRVDDIQFEEKRISLGLPSGGEDVSWKSHTDSKSNGFGSMSDAFKGLQLKK